MSAPEPSSAPAQPPAAPARRDAARAFARERGLPVTLIEVTCDPAETRRRLAARERDPARISDAGADFYDVSVAAFEAPDEWPAKSRHRVATDAPDWREALRSALA